MLKNKLLANLQNDVYCRIMPSTLHGVGVFAIKDIPFDMNPFQLSNGQHCINYRIINLTDNDLKYTAPHVMKIIKDFYQKNGDYYPVHSLGPNANDISFSMNHSNFPNVDIIPIPNCPYCIYNTNRQIKQGEELLINYNFE